MLEWLWHTRMRLDSLHVRLAGSVLVPVSDTKLFSAFPLLSLLQRDGCPKIVNLGSAKTDLFYERKKYGFKKR